MNRFIRPSRQANACKEPLDEKGFSASLPQVGTWEWDFTSGALTWSDGLYRILGIEPGAVPASYDLFVKKMHPEDRPASKAVRRAAMTEGGGIDNEFRIVRCDG